jgi:hypothetical protein
MLLKLFRLLAFSATVSAYALEKRMVCVDNVGVNSYGNTNTVISNLYPKRLASDRGVYTQTEATLRSAIYIPSNVSASWNFLLLFPGTALPAGCTYQNNLVSQLWSRQVNPVWVNVPSNSIGDSQVTAEFAAYTINYLNARYNKKIYVLGASQGSLNVQWALKYWGSARSSITGFISVSGEFHGTTIDLSLAYDLQGHISLPQTLWQQSSTSQFVTHLLLNGGNTALVPTTSIWSANDEQISPHGPTNGSELLLPPFPNTFTPVIVQTACTGHGTAATGNYSHVEVLFHPLTIYVIQNVITNSGIPVLSQLNLNSICSTQWAPDLTDSASDQDTSLGYVAETNIATNTYYSSSEPALMSYAVSY